MRTVYPNAALSDDLIAEGAHETNDSALGCSIIDKFGVSFGEVDGCVERDRAPRGHVRYGVLDYVKEGIYVGVKSLVPVGGF